MVPQRGGDATVRDASAFRIGRVLRGVGAGLARMTSRLTQRLPLAVCQPTAQVKSPLRGVGSRAIVPRRWQGSEFSGERD